MNTEIKFRLNLEGAPRVQSQVDGTARSFQNLSQETKQAAASSEQLDSAMGRVAGAFASLRGLLQGVAAAGAVRAMVQTADAVTVMRNQLELSTGSAAKAMQAYDALFGIAQRSRVSFTELGGTFASIARATDGLGISQQRLLTVTQAIGNAMAVSGGSAAGMQAALTQLGQGLASGTLRGDELNSVLEQTPRLARAIADGMGVTVGKLRELGQEGKITAEAVLRALESQASTLSREVSGSVVTVSQAMTQMANSATKAVAELDRSSGASSAITQAMQAMSNTIDDVADRFARAREAGRGFFGSLLAAQVSGAAEALGYIDQGAANVGRRLSEAEKELARLQERFAQRGGYYLANEVAKADELVRKLREAKQAQDDLKRPDPRDQTQFKTRSQSIAAFDAEEAKAAQLLANARNQALGVNATWLKQVQELNAARQAGYLTEQQYAEAVKATTAATYGLSAAAKAQATAMAAGKKLAEQIALTTAGFSGDFLEDWKKLEAAHKSGALSAVAYADAHERLIAQQPVMQAMAKAAMESAIAVQEARKAESDGIEAYLRQQKDAAMSAVQSARDRRNALQDEEQAAALAQATNTSLAQAIETVAIARLNERLQQLDGESPAAKALKEEIALRRQVLTLMGRKETREANVQAARDASAAWQRMADDAGAALTNAIMTGGRSAGEQLKAYFKTLVLRPIIEAAVSPLTGAIAAFLSGGGAASGGSAGAMAGLNNASTLVSLYQAATGYSGGVNALAAYLGAGGTAGASSLSLAYANAVGATGGDALGALIASNGSWAGVGTSASQLAASEAAQLFASQAAGEGITVASSTSAGAAGGSGSSAMGSFGAYAAYAAMIYAAAQYASKLYGQGFTGSKQLDGKSWYDYSDKAINREVFEALGLSEKWTEILSGSVRWNHMFGRAAPRITDSGFSGSIGAGDFSGQLFADVLEKGGLFRSDKRYTQTSALPDDLGRFLDDASTAVFDQAKRFGEALGLPAQELASITSQVRVVLTDDAEKNKAEIAKTLGQYGDALIAGWADEVAPLKQYGETVAQTIARVGGAIVSVNQVLEGLGMRALQASVSGGQAALQLQQFFGGVDKLGAAAGQYASKFFSEAERTSMQAEAIAASLAGVNLKVPATRDGFRALVEAQDLNTEAGRRAFTVLLANADAFDAVAASAERASEKLAQEAAARAKSLDDAIAKNLPKFLSPADQRTLQFQRIQADLQGVGVSIGLEQLMGASKAEVLAFAQAFINLADGASTAEIAVANAAGALADMADQAAEAAEDARRTAADQAAERASRQASLNSAFDNLVSGLKQGVGSAYADVQQIIGAERQRTQSEAEKAIDALEQQAERVTRTYSDLIGSLGDAVQQLSDDLSGDGGRGRALGTLQGALADLSAGRDVDTDAVRAAATTAARLDPAAFGSAFEFRKAQATTASLLREVSAAATQRQTTALGAIAQQQVKVEMELEKQLTKLDDQLKEARSAAGSLVNIDTGVQTVAGALARLAESMNAVKAVEGKGGPTGQWLGSGGNEVWASPGGAVAARPAGANLDGTIIRGLKTSFTAAEAQAFVQDRLAADDVTGIYWRAVAEGIDSSSLDALMNWAPGTSLAEALRRGLPAFATGSPWVPSTGLALVHQGERIIPAPDNAILMQRLSEGGGAGQAAVVAELRAQFAEMRAMHADLMDGVQAIAHSSDKSARFADDLASGQVAIRTREVAV